MKKILFFGAAALALASCSNDETVKMNDENAISFKVSTQNNSRAAETFCANNLPGDFNVWALTADNKTALNGVNFKKGADNTYSAADGVTRYWPDGNVTFYGLKNEGSATFSLADAKLSNFTVKDNVKEQLDLLYAKTVTQKTANGGKATLNFRHALAQVVFKAENTNTSIHVEVSGVTVGNLNNAGDYTISSVTDGAIVNHDFAGTDVTTRGTWNNLSGSANYSIAFDAVTLTATAADLSAAQDANTTANNAMLLIPTEYTAWDPAKKAESFSGTYFLVNCVIYNVSGSAVDKEKDIVLWGDVKEDGTVAPKTIAIPATINWTEGKRYTYTFKFGNGNGGYTPDPNDPEPVLVPITFTCSVDDFVDGGNTDVDME